MLMQVFEPNKSPTIPSNGEDKKATKHAPDLLEGPDVDDDGI